MNAMRRFGEIPVAVAGCGGYAAVMCPSNGRLTKGEIDLFIAARDAVLGKPNSANPTAEPNGRCDGISLRGNAEFFGKEIVEFLRRNGPTLAMRIAFLKTLNYGVIRAFFFAVNHPNDELFELMAHKIISISRRLP